MATIKIEEKENIAILRLDNGTKNAVNLAMVEDISAAVKTIQQDYNGMVLAGGDTFFCIGLSLPELTTLDRPGMTDFWYKFNQLTLDLYTLSVPTACAIAGHAPAVGTIWALACDYRFAAAGKKVIGLNEINLGLPTPFLVDLMLRQAVSDQVANDLLYGGVFVTPEQAQEFNLIHEVTLQGEVEERALSKLEPLTALSKRALAAIKAVRTDDIRLRFEQDFKVKHEIFLDCWFSKETQEILVKAAEKF